MFSVLESKLMLCILNEKLKDYNSNAESKNEKLKHRIIKSTGI